GEFQVNTYPTLSSAQSDHLFERGWLPEVLPAGSGPIVEAHDLDTNARCSKSVFPADASAQVSQALLALGFQAFSGELPPLPFSRCPFSLERARSSESAFINTRGADSDREFAVIGGCVLYFWSS
ncbi:MAG: hypothetical protein OER90_16965, partial [Gemmatimonadota bacterium]|nr:hypothetical protein [Gemmatimonadota bacterium]